MPDFEYTARDLQGNKVNGVVAAPNQRDALVLLSGQALFPLEVKTQQQAKPLFGGRRVSGNLMAVTYVQLASLMRSGVPLLRSLSLLRDQASNSKLKETLTDVVSRVEEGESLSDAMSRHPRVFHEIAVNMARAGTEGGFLEDALDHVGRFTEQQEDLKSRTIGALAYPVFLSVIGTLVVAFLLIFMVPSFGTMFDRLRARGELPILTEWLLAFSNTLQDYWLIITLAVIVLVVLIRNQIATPAGRRMIDRWKLKIPVVGSIYQSLAVARFCRVLGTLLKNMVPIIKSMEISQAATGNTILSDAISRATDNISSGESLAKPLGASSYFPGEVVEMISVAEESNTLDTVLVEVADSLERRTIRRLDLFVRLLEPIMLLMMAGVVLLVVIALLLPVIKMSSTI